MTAVESRVASPLRRILESTADEAGCGLGDLTVLATQNDPFRIDTPARHRDGEWLADTARELGLGDRRIHLRGLHYMVIGRPKPNGTPYTNTDEDWAWLSEHAGKAARWLGYLPFDQITDQRNTPPIVQTFTSAEPYPYLTVGVDVDIPDVDDIVPRIEVEGFRAAQAYKLVLFGEKSSLTDVLAPAAQSYHADMYLPTGEISDTMLHQMARVGAVDGRPMVVLCFSDADPAGWQMPISIARKLQALKALYFADLHFEVRRIGLTPDQVREHGLPSTPLKATERRADRWRDRMGVDQTEIDALASLRPDLLRQIVNDAVAPYFDGTLDERVWRAEQEWRDDAQAVVDEAVDSEALGRLRADAAVKLAAMRQQIDEINDALRVDADGFDLPPMAVPTAVADGSDGTPLVDSRWSFGDQTQALIASKAYRSPPSRTPRPQPADRPPIVLAPGDEVTHDVFGVGTVLDTRGRGRDTQAQIDFGTLGAKWLVLRFAPLHKQSPSGGAT